MQPAARQFKTNAAVALHNEALQTALARAKSGFVDKRLKAIRGLPEFDRLCAEARSIKEHTLQHLDFYLQRYEQQVVRAGGQVHWASTPREACEAIVGICRSVDGKRVTKGKSMVAEEIALNPALEAAGLEVIETDLGEYIIQLANEPPSHIIAPAVHKTRDEISDLFHEHHEQYGLLKRLTAIPDLVNEARSILRQRFLSADVGITGANFLIAETGSSVIVTNEGNGDLTSSLPRVHIVVASIDKLVPNLDDATTLIRLLGRSATGQAMTSYTTFATGARRALDLDGPEQYHVVLVDNGRSTMLGNEFRDMLRCIRCGACLNHCPVYGAVGGHAYGWVYPGPMGSVLTPLMVGLEEAADLPNACTLNGRCQQVCPMDIPLPQMLRGLRQREYEAKLSPPRVRWALRLWAFLAARPTLYHAVVALPLKLMGAMGRKRGRFARLPLASGWTRSRDMPAPQGETFIAAWARERGRSAP